MDKFASRAMLQIVEAGFKKNKFDIEELQSKAQPTALIPKATKSNALKAINAKYGLEGVVSLASGVDEVSQDPLRMALLRAKSPEDLFERWSKIQLHIHSNHRIRWSLEHQKCIAMRHDSTDNNMPQPEETCFVISVLIKLLQMIGTIDIKCESGDGNVMFELDKWKKLEIPKVGCDWYLRFKSMSKVTTYAESGDFAATLKKMIRDDLCYGWSLKRASAELNISSRTLQRRLKKENESFQRLVSTERSNSASKMLLENDASLTEIGFLCGYSDSAHFSSSFLKETSFTPKAFRSSFKN